MLTDTTYTIEELSANSDNLSINDADVLEFHYAGSMDTVKVNDHLKINPQNYFSKIELGELEIQINRSYRDSSLNFMYLLPGIEYYHGTSQIVDPFSFSYIETDPVELTDIEYAKISSGTAVVTVENYLPVPLGPPVTAEIFDGAFNLIQQVNFSESIPANGGTAQQVVDLSGTTVSSPLYIKLSGQSPGSSGNSVFIDMNDYVVIDIFMETLQASEARAKIEPIILSSDKQVELTNEMSITEAQIHSGSVELKLQNYAPIGASGTIIFEDIFDATGSTLKIDLSLAANAENGRPRASFTEIPSAGTV